MTPTPMTRPRAAQAVDPVGACRRCDRRAMSDTGALLCALDPNAPMPAEQARAPQGPCGRDAATCNASDAPVPKPASSTLWLRCDMIS